MIAALVVSLHAMAQNADYKFVDGTLVKSVQNADGTVTKYNVFKPIVLVKAKFEHSTEDAASKFSIRHATLGVRGDVSQKLSYMYHIDFCTENKITVLDLYIRAKLSNRLTLTLGQQYHPLFNSWTVAPNDVDYINRPFVGKYFASSRDIGVTAKYALKQEGFPINLEYGVYNGTGINNPTWNNSMVTGGRIELGSVKKGFRSTVKYFKAKNQSDETDLYWGADMRYAGTNFKIEAEVMTNNMKNILLIGDHSAPHSLPATYSPHSLSAVYVQAMYKIKSKNPSLKSIDPLLRWDGMGYDMKERGLGLNRITAGVNFVFNTRFTSMFRINYEQYFNNSMDMSKLYKELHYNHNKISLEYLIYFL